MNLTTALARLLIFPGLLFAVPAAWFMLWVERKSVALMQGRVGPPFMQPFFDFVKLLGKDTPPRPGIGGMLMRAWPLIAVSAAAGAVGLLPVLPMSGGFEGDLILLLALLELPSMCIIAAGFSSRSIFGEIGSAREAVLSVAYNIVFLLAIGVHVAGGGHKAGRRGMEIIERISAPTAAGIAKHKDGRIATGKDEIGQGVAVNITQGSHSRLTAGAAKSGVSIRQGERFIGLGNTGGKIVARKEINRIAVANGEFGCAVAVHITDYC